MLNDLALLVRSGNPLISIETLDETRATQLVYAVADELNLPLYEWSLTEGLTSADAFGKEESLVKAGNLGKALEKLGKVQNSAIYLFKDLGPHCKDAATHRKIRDLIENFSKYGKSMIILDALPLPEEMQKFTVSYSIGWPDSEELENVVRQTFRRIQKENDKEVKHSITKKEMEQVVQSLRGLNCSQAERVIASVIYHDNELTGDDLQRVVDLKRTILGSTGSLESISADFDVDDIGGLDNLKGWLKQRRGAFSKRAEEFGLDFPRGVLMLGVPGCGKSLCAKVVAADWGMPLLRLDPGVLYNKFIGSSESQLRQALSQAESMAPCILWVDEIEKAFASASAASADGGLSKRMFGTLLSWMQDHRHPIFMVATANDISSLPPEMMRKGRFDEVFFVDLPDNEARQQIFEIHLRRKKRDPEDFDLEELADRAVDFTGSEIEQLIISALFAAFSEREELNTKHIVSEIKKTNPLAKLMSERIRELRAWSEDRCVPAD